MRRAWLVAVLLAGCADNAVLELDLGLPPESFDGINRFAFVQARSGLEPFDEPWGGTDPVDGFRLGLEPHREELSIVAEEGAIAEPLRIKIRYCFASRCTALSDAEAPQAEIEIERAFYEASRTFLTLDVTGMDEAIAIEKCRVRGCIGGSVSTFCRGDGTHFCE